MHALFQTLLKRVGIGMWIDMFFSMRQTAAIDQTGVIFNIAQNHILPIGQCRNHAGIGGKSRREEQGCFGLLKLSQCAFQPVMH